MQDRGTPETMGLGILEYVIDEFTDTFGSISLVDMTPIVGEITNTPEWHEMFRYLYENTDVDKFDVVTNFIDFSRKDILRLMRYKDKFSMVISVYGHDRDSYFESTGVDKWDDFVDSITDLQEALTLNEYECFPITFYFRHKPFEDFPKDSFAYKFIKAIQLITKTKVTFDNDMAGINHNWAGQVDVPEPVVAVPLTHDMPTCVHAILQNCVMPNGDITLCGMNDVHGKLLIGNIFTSSLEEIYGEDSRYASYIEHMPDLCKKCSEYDAKTCEPEDVREHEDKLDKIR
jgi:hypothetical protein